MIKLVLFVLVGTIIATGYLQEITNSVHNQQPSNDGSPLWSLQNYQVPQKKTTKPCRRKNNEEGKKWIPSFSSKVTHPLNPFPAMMPLALKNEKPNEDSQTIEEQRAIYLSNIKSTNPNEEDCEEFDPNETSSSLETEQKAMKIMKDCLEKKHRNKSTSSSPIAFRAPGSRRSMSGPDQDAETESDKNGLDTVDATEQLSNFSRSGSFEERRNVRICFACSTATNPSCWTPDERTTVKYCRSEQSCVTKIFEAKKRITFIRDCGDSCEDSTVPGLQPKYQSCKVCHSDYCNAAVSINGFNLAFIITTIILSIKCKF